jgi:hypothetical protein
VNPRNLDWLRGDRRVQFGQHLAQRHPVFHPFPLGRIGKRQQALRKMPPYLFFRVGPKLYTGQPDKNFHHVFPGGTTKDYEAFLNGSGLIELIFRQKLGSS